MEIITRQIETNQTDRRLFDQFMIDEDFNVPDSKNDVENAKEPFEKNEHIFV